MVVFTCNYCGDSVRKPQVEKHYINVCRGVKNLTCVDCLKDFRGEEFDSHTKCLTEDERYAAKGSFVNGNVKKGELEQQSFVNMIRSLAERKDVPNGVKHLLNYLSNYSNVPRKKQKYLNFIRNSFNGSIKVQDAEKVWDLIEKYKPTVKKNVNSQTEQKRRLDLSIEFLENVTLKKKKKVGGEKWSDPEETKVERFDSLEDVVNKNVSIRTLIAENVKLKKTIHVKELESEFAKRFLPYLDDEHSVDVGEIFKKKLKNLKNVKVENNLVSCNK